MEVYSYCIEKFDVLKDSPFRRISSQDMSFDFSLFMKLLLETKKNIKELIDYLDGHSYFFEEAVFSQEDALKLVKWLSSFEKDDLTDNFASMLQVVVKGILKDKTMTKHELSQFFNTDFCRRIYSNLQGAWKDEFLNVMVPSILEEQQLLRLADAIGVDQISTDLLNQWECHPKRRKKTQ